MAGFPVFMMPESSSARKNELGPDYFGYYRHLFFELFPQSGDATSAPSKPDLESLLGYPRDNGSITSATNNSKDRVFHRPVSFFTGVIGEDLSKYKKERLKSVLHQTAVCFNQEADEVHFDMTSFFGLTIIDALMIEKSSLSEDLTSLVFFF